MAFDYESWLKTAQDRLESLYEQKVAIESEITALEDGIKGFAPLVNQPALWFGPDAGITDAIRAVLKANPTRLFTPTEIRNELLARGVSLTQQNPMASIHQILARLVGKGTAKISCHEAGRNRYRWGGGAETKPKPKTLGERIADGNKALEEAAEALGNLRKKK